jgi:GR25 family glycosyltransferase involved in LPS biosynthesis
MITFFDKIYCINLDSRTDRLALCTEQLLKYGANEFERFSAHALENGAHGHCKTYCALIDTCLAQGLENCLLLEDDVSFTGNVKEFKGILNVSVSELPGDWDALYLGGTLCDNYTSSPISTYSKNLYRLHSAFATQAVAFSRKGLIKIRESFSDSQDWWRESLIKTNGYSFDVFLAKDFLPSSNCFITKEMLCGQCPDWSNILNTHTDYNKLMLDRFNHYKSQIHE